MTDEHRLFLDAVQALDAGDLRRLEALLDDHPDLIRYRARTGEWYEDGYFAGATLLHHVAGNPDRGSPLPANIVEIARVLLERGAGAEAAQYTLGLVLTSRRASHEGVAMPLIDLLVAAGATLDLDDPNVLSLPLLNDAPETAEALVRRGAAMDVRHAAALGRLEGVSGDVARPVLEESLAFACIRGQQASAAELVRRGATGDVLVAPGGRTPRTALHEAANRGHAGIVELLLDNGADAGVVEPRWGGTAADWAEHGGHAAVAAMLRER